MLSHAQIIEVSTCEMVCLVCHVFAKVSCYPPVHTGWPVATSMCCLESNQKPEPATDGAVSMHHSWHVMMSCLNGDALFMHCGRSYLYKLCCKTTASAHPRSSSCSLTPRRCSGRVMSLPNKMRCDHPRLSTVTKEGAYEHGDIMVPISLFAAVLGGDRK